MKKIFILLASVAILTSCETHNQHNDENIAKRVEFFGTFRNNSDGASIYLYKIDGHDYGAIYHGSLTHLESCKLCFSKKSSNNEKEQ